MLRKSESLKVVSSCIVGGTIYEDREIILVSFPYAVTPPA
jgi:hypothetical protein